MDALIRYLKFQVSYAVLWQKCEKSGQSSTYIVWVIVT